MIKLTFPDNSVREFEAGVTGAAIAEGRSATRGALPSARRAGAA